MSQRPWSGLSHGQIVHQVTNMKSLQLATSCPGVLKKFIFKCVGARASAGRKRVCVEPCGRVRTHALILSTGLHTR